MVDAGPCRIEPALGQAARSDPMPPPNSEAHSKPTSGPGKILAIPALTQAASKRRLWRIWPSPSSYWFLSLPPRLQPEFHRQSSSIWYDEAVTLPHDFGPRDTRVVPLFPSLAWPAQVKLVAQEPGRWDIGAFRHTP